MAAALERLAPVLPAETLTPSLQVLISLGWKDDRGYFAETMPELFTRLVREGGPEEIPVWLDSLDSSGALDALRTSDELYWLARYLTLTQARRAWSVAERLEGNTRAEVLAELALRLPAAEAVDRIRAVPLRAGSPASGGWRRNSSRPNPPLSAKAAHEAHEPRTEGPASQPQGCGSRSLTETSARFRVAGVSLLVGVKGFRAAGLRVLVVRGWSVVGRPGTGRLRISRSWGLVRDRWVVLSGRTVGCWRFSGRRVGSVVGVGGAEDCCVFEYVFEWVVDLSGLDEADVGCVV
ncbi:hypothetical protein OG257_36590 [Streptomyces sp. NBC_00683]|uniref:hypothetical protein n=1 Tax=Streptomyces sp. NBC_00683 TaxID=2903670 RepID=UPI002E2F84F3|nr:hypothetical protein [Streptomyces sp. NBC_00683]